MEQQFASDNYAGICPEALASADGGERRHAPAYGEDEWTRRVSDRLRALFETDCDVASAFNGTAANSLALASLCQSYHSVICHELAHVDTDECGGPEFFSNGSKLLPAKGEGGKLTPDAVREVIARRSDIHYPKPRVVTLTQATEVGTVYRPAEIAAVAEMAHASGLRVHYGRRPLRQCRRLAGCFAGGCDLACRGRRALLRRHQDGPAGRRGGGLLRPPAVGGFSRIAASRPGSWPRRCASSPHPGSGCWKAMPGCATHATPMPWRSGWPAGWRRCPA